MKKEINHFLVHAHFKCNGQFIGHPIIIPADNEIQAAESGRTWFEKFYENIEEWRSLMCWNIDTIRTTTVILNNGPGVCCK